MSGKHHPVAPRVDAMQPWLRVVFAMEDAGWDTHHSTGHHQRLAWACAAAFRLLEHEIQADRESPGRSAK